MVRKNAIGIRFCYGCGSDKTYLNNGRKPAWIANKPTDLFLCSKCFKIYIYDPIYSLKRCAHILGYKGRLIVLPVKPRKGVCSKCGKSVHKGEIKKTNMHHFAEYHDDDLLRDTIELCVGCHIKKHRASFPKTRKRRIKK